MKHPEDPNRAPETQEFKAAPHPMQPIALDTRGVARFKRNYIVEYLMDLARVHGVDLNALAQLGFSQVDWQQFSQLTGYSVSGFGDLSYADPLVVRRADAIVRALVRP